MSDSSRPDQIEGVSTDRGATKGDPELRSNTSAPDLSEQADADDDRAGTRKRHADVSDDVASSPGDTTPGTQLNPQ